MTSQKEKQETPLHQSPGSPGVGQSNGEKVFNFLTTSGVMQEMLTPPCARGLGPHRLVKMVALGMRDNGEYEARCAECGRIL